MLQLENFTLVVNEDIQTQLSHHLGRFNPSVDEITISDIKDMLPFIPETATKVVDLCCGTGRVSIALSRYILPNAEFFLVDGNVEAGVNDIERHWDRYTSDGVARFYNKKELTVECCRLNNFSNYEYVEVDAGLHWSKFLTDVDFLFSNRGIGCHWPLELYASIFPRILKDGAICIFMDGKALGKIPEYFSKIAVIHENWLLGRQLVVFRYNKLTYDSMMAFKIPTE